MFSQTLQCVKRILKTLLDGSNFSLFRFHCFLNIKITDLQLDDDYRSFICVSSQ